MAELRASMGALEMDRWRLYYLEEPWGATRDNLHAATIASIIANVHRDPKKSKAFSPNDFMIQGEGKRKARAQAGQQALLKFLRTMAKGKRKKMKKEAKK